MIGSEVEIAFDPTKRDRTLAERDLDFARSPEVFAQAITSFDDKRVDYGERRRITVGYLDDRMVIVVWTERDGLRRIISMRKANERERARYRSED